MKNIIFVFALIFSWLLVSAACANEEEWLGLQDARYALKVNYGKESDDQSVWDFSLNFPAPAYSEVFISYSKFEVADGETSEELQGYSVAWASDPYADWQVGLAYSFKGKSDAVEVTQTQLDIFHNQGNWQAGFLYFDGDVKGFTRDIISDRFNIPDSAKINRNGYGFVLAHLGQTLMWQLSTNSFEYSRDLSNALNSRLFLLSFNDAVISQVLSLTNWTAGLQLEKKFDNFSLNFGVEQFEEVVDKRQDITLSTGARFQVNKNIDVILGYFYLLEEGTNQANLGAVFRW